MCGLTTRALAEICDSIAKFEEKLHRKPSLVYILYRLSFGICKNWPKLELFTVLSHMLVNLFSCKLCLYMCVCVCTHVCTI